MKLLHKTFILLVLAATIPAAANAQCLTTEQEDALISVAQANNLSPSFFVDIFDSFCDRSYDKNTTEQRLNDTISNLTSQMADLNITTKKYVNDTIGEYKEWVENQTDLNGLLKDMINLMNASQNLEDIQGRIDNANLETVDQLDEMISNFKSEYMTREQAIQLINQKTPEAPAQPDYSLAILGIAVLLIAAYFFRDNIKSTPWRGRAERFAGSIRHSQPAQTHLPPVASEYRRKEDGIAGAKKDTPPAAGGGDKGRKKGD